MRVATIAAVFLPCVVFSFSTSITIKFSGSVVDRWQPIKSAATHHEEVNHVDERDDLATTSSSSNGSNGSASDGHISGTRDGYIITKLYTVPFEGFPSLSTVFEQNDQERLQLEAKNVTLPAALMLLDPDKYPTQSRARKAIRQKAICICRDSNDDTEFDKLGKVIDRIYPQDQIGFQQRGGTDYYAVQGVPYRLPSFEVPVLYEDDHMAIVNKPAGIVSYRAEGGRGGGARGGHGRDTLLSALPSVLSPSNVHISDDDWPLKRPQPVHRLDRPTSGLVVVAKTKSASVHLSQQFEFRRARKTYMAILNGYPHQPKDDDFNKDDWNVIDYDLDDSSGRNRSAITQWKVLQTAKSLHANNGTLTLVELRPKTGRYHQLRRHMAWVCKSPICGDSTYDEGSLRLRKRGLFLCSNEIMIEHPYYNNPIGRKEWEWDRLKKDAQNLAMEHLQEDEETGRVIVQVRIDLPSKFESFLRHEDERASKFSPTK